MSKDTYILFGGGGGIGRSLVRRLQQREANVIVASRNQSNHESLTHIESVACDASDFSAVENVLSSAHEKYGEVHGVVCMAGSIVLKPAHMVNEQEWLDTVSTNLTTAFACVRAAGKVMKNGGSVVLVSTVAAATGLPNHEAIAATKAGVEGLARSAAATYAGRGLRVNVVAPGLVDTPLAERITRSEKALEHSRKMHPLGRIGTPDDISSPIDWLLSNDSSWVTGQTIGVDGGLGKTRASAT